MKKYSGQTMWVLICVWTVIMVWFWYVAYQFMTWNGNLWFALIVSYVAVLFPILSFADVKWE